MKDAALARRRAALAQANLVRQERAAIKQALRGGELQIAELLADPPPSLASARLATVLAAAPGYGEVRVARLLRSARISALKTVGSLSARQRAELVGMLGGQARDRPEGRSRGSSPD